MDGGQTQTIQYAGYSRQNGTPQWFEVEQSFDKLYSDYQFHEKGKRKWGVWNLNEVTLIDKAHAPERNTEELAKHALWGTRGLNGDENLHYILLSKCCSNHLSKIKAICEERENTELIKIINTIQSWK